MKKTLACILSVCLLIGTMSVSMTAFAAKADAVRKTTVIVEMAGDSVLAGASTQDDVVCAQRDMVQEIEDAVDRFDVTYSYTHVLNAVAAEVRVGEIDAIRAMDGVVGVYETAGAKPVMQSVRAAGEISSGEMIGLQDVHEKGYDGTGTAIAVIDGGFDTEHETMRLTNDSTAKLSKSDIAAVIKANEMNSEAIKADDVYVNAKIPFAFDYCDEDTELNDYHNADPDHGSHVCGIAAGNSARLTGIAPEAQVLMFKIDIYDDETFLANLLAAVDDAAKFDVDAMNLSVGIAFEIPDDPVYDLMAKAFANARANGILVCTAAGNDGIFSDLVNMPDNGTNGIPNGFAGATSVASVDNIYLSDRIGKTPEKVIYDENKSVGVTGWALIVPFPDEALTLVPTGDRQAEKNLAGNCALVYKTQSGYSSLMKKLIKSDAAAVIFNEDVIWDMYYGGGMDVEELLDDLIMDKPLLLVSSVDSYRLYHSKSQTVSLQYSEGYYAEPAETLQPSYFTSWGIGEDGSMTVDIAAPGGVIHSAIANMQYDVMSGTSMASPHMCGAGALMAQRLAKQMPSLTGKEKSDLSENLLMSTADPIAQEGTYASVRAVGAGLVNLSRAMQANAVLLGSDNHSALNLGDKIDRTFKMTFTVKNISDKTVRYDHLSIALQADEYEKQRVFDEETGVFEDNYYITGNCVPLGFKMQSDMPRSIVLQKGESRDVTVTVQIDDEDYDCYAKIFTAGFFVEGYVFLSDLSDSTDASTSLNMPFLGFAGDWDAVPALDVFTDTWYGETETSVYAVRSLRELRYVLTDANGETVAESSENNVKKYTYIDVSDVSGKFEDAPDGTYTLTLYAVPFAAKEGAEQAYPMGEVRIDNMPPQIVRMKTERAKDGSGTITVTMHTDDASYFVIEGGSLFNATFFDLYPVDGYDRIDEDGNYVYVLEESKLPIGWFVVTAYDSAEMSDSKGIFSPTVWLFRLFVSAWELVKEVPELISTLFIWLILLGYE